MASSNLSMLVMEMIRSRKDERTAQKNRAYDMWKLRETQEYNNKITEETREYNKEHELFVISNDKEKTAHDELLKVQFEAEKLGVNLDTVSDLYASDDSISKLMKELVVPEIDSYKNLTEYYEDDTKRNQVVQYAWDKLNEVFSFNAVKQQIENIRY